MKNRQKLFFELIIYVIIVIIGVFVLLTGKGLPKKDTKEMYTPTSSPTVTNMPIVPTGE